MSEARDSKDPKEVLEMREALIAFRRAARGVKESQRNLPRISGRMSAVAPEAAAEEREDENTTKKVLVPA